MYKSFLETVLFKRCSQHWHLSWELLVFLDLAGRRNKDSQSLYKLEQIQPVLVSCDRADHFRDETLQGNRSAGLAQPCSAQKASMPL